jgi:predicted nucleic acid-binding protein
MKRIVADASAIGAIAFGEPEGEPLTARLDGAAIFAPTLLALELANTALKKIRRQPDKSAAFLEALNDALSDERGIILRPVQAADVVLVAQALGCSAYDAAYIWLAGMLGADLVTLDKRLIQLSAMAVA